MASTNKGLWLCLGVMFLFGALTCQALQVEDDMNQKFEQWMLSYGRVYASATEKERRFQIFKDNVAYIESSNSENKSYKLGINQFADLTDEEFEATFLTGTLKGPARREEEAPFRYENITVVPDSIDWRTKGAVTHVKNQGQWGTCWSFTAVACTEGLKKITTGKLVSLSEQELIDCTSNLFMHDVYMFIKSNGLSSEADYPYSGAQGTCNQNKSSAARITGYEFVPENNELALLHAVANQPVSVAIDGGSLKLYTSGVFNEECGTNLNHAVTVVGYGTSPDGTQYWIMKNSWGRKWGMDGYVLMKRNVSELEGQCGLAMAATYPISGEMKPPTNTTGGPTSGGGMKGNPIFILFTLFITYFFKFLV